MGDRRNEVLRELRETAAVVRQAAKRTASLLREGDDLRIPKQTLADAAEISRRSVYNILERPDQEEQ